MTELSEPQFYLVASAIPLHEIKPFNKLPKTHERDLLGEAYEGKKEESKRRWKVPSHVNACLTPFKQKNVKPQCVLRKFV